MKRISIFPVLESIYFVWVENSLAPSPACLQIDILSACKQYFASKNEYFAWTEQSWALNILSVTENILPGLSRLLDLHRPTSTQRLPQVQCSPFNKVVGVAFKVVYVKEKLTWKPLGYLKATGTFTRLASDVPEGWNTRTASLVVSSKLKYRPAESFDTTSDTNHSFMCNELDVSSPLYIC